MYSKSIAVLKSKFFSKKYIFSLLSLCVLTGCFSSSRVMIPESLPPDAYARDSDSSINNENTPVVTPDRIPPPIKESPTEKKSFLDQFESFDSSFWIMPDEIQDISHRTWINESYGVKILDYQTYIAPTYERVKKIMYVSLQLCGLLSLLSEPFLPNASKKIRQILNIKETKWTELTFSNPILKEKKQINKPYLIFRKIEDEEIKNQINKLNS